MSHLSCYFLDFRKSKLSDDDDLDVKVEAPAVVKTILPVVAWHTPSLLPARTDAAPPQVNSREKAAQTTRMTGVTAAKFSSEFSVPNNPTPLSDVEQALDMTSQSSTVTQTIPFFVPQVTAPTPAVQAAIPDMSIASATSVYPVTQAPPASGVASTEIVQSLGLPMFLVGQNIQALQTLASTPSLLSTFVDSNGMYDQVRLMNLVQTLSQGSTPSLTQPTAGFPHHTSPSFGSSPDAYGQTPAGGGIYGPASTDQGAFGTSFTSGGLKNGGYRGAQNSGDGNLHLSGYGPSTSQAEIIALFSPYVQVDEVVMKGTFCFVNTNDPVGAKRAREALNGALLGGQPVRINMAQRKNRDSAPPGADLFNKGAPSDTSAYYGRQHSAPPPSTGFSPAVAAHNPVFGQPPGIPPPGIPPPAQLPVQSQSHIDYSQVRDDRGNPATKNLFVAGYGQGTSEQVLRQIFAPHCEIIGIIMKGTFSFINTSDKGAAVRAREMLSGTLLNGGVLRINFAKETGRLGTSFDLTYGGSSQPRSHYGPRGY
jgi:RNA recognition motif-containing protein